MKRFSILLIITAVLFSSCHYFGGKRINGSGKVISQARTFSGFTGVDVSSAITVYVKQDPSFSVKVETDDKGRNRDIKITVKYVSL